MSLFTRHAPGQHLRGEFIEQPLRRLRLLTFGPQESCSALGLLEDDRKPFKHAGTPQNPGDVIVIQEDERNGEDLVFQPYVHLMLPPPDF
jgi:hypothetical protein